MICVEDVKICQVERDTFVRTSRGAWNEEGIAQGKVLPKNAGFKTEEIRGRVFANACGEEICLSMTREVQLTLGLPFEVFDNMEKKMSVLCQEERRSAALLVISNLKVAAYEGAGFFKRMKYLFTGKMEW